MKTQFFSFKSSVLLIALVSMIFTSCRDRAYEELKYVANVPVYMDFKSFRASVVKTEPQAMVQPGKIYMYNNYLFINEIQKGVHVIDNTNPAAPNSIGFINILGNMDIAIKENILFADSYMDLVAIDISNPQNPVEIERVENAFPHVIPAINDAYPVYGLDFEKGVVIGWEKKEVVEVIEKGSLYRGDYLYFDAVGQPQLGSGEIGIIGGNTGKGGSMARFTIIADYLYAVHNSALKLFNIAHSPGIVQGAELQLDRLVETIYPFEDHLFLGTTTGMLVYNLNNPAIPAFVSVFEHISSCDPVVVDGNFAYVTLRSGNNCNNMVNLLEVVDISSLEHPFSVKSYPMYNPHGLGIENKTLFICDGDAGLKVYDATDPMEIHQHQLAHFPDIKSYDVICHNGLLMMIGADGLYQYDYTDLNNLQLLSTMPIVKAP